MAGNLAPVLDVEHVQLESIMQGNLYGCGRGVARPRHRQTARPTAHPLISGAI